MAIKSLEPEAYSRADLAGAALLILVMSLAVLFPENYMPDALMIGSRKLLPLTLILPLFLIGSLAYIWFRRGFLDPDFIDAVLIGFTVYFLARNIAGPAGGAAVKYAAYGIGLFYVTSLLVLRDRPRQAVWMAIVALTGLAAIYGFIEYAIGENFIYGRLVGEAVVEDVGALHRAGSSLAHPVAFGAFLVQLLPFTILAWLQGGSRNFRLIGAIVSLSAAAAIFFTFSKGSWITAAIVILAATIVFLAGRGSRALLPMLVIVVFAAAITGIFWQQAASETSGRMDKSVDLRIAGWRGAYTGIINDPLTGVGLRQGRTEILEHCYECRSFHYFEGREKPVDNNYINTLLEQGFIGFFLWMTFLVLLITSGIAALQKDHDTRPWLLAGLASVIALCINAVTFDAMLIWSTSTVFWITAGILHGSVLRAKSVDP